MFGKVAPKTNFSKRLHFLKSAALGMYSRLVIIIPALRRWGTPYRGSGEVRGRRQNLDGVNERLWDGQGVEIEARHCFDIPACHDQMT